MRRDVLPAVIAIVLIGTAACTNGDAPSPDAARGAATAQSRPDASASPAHPTSPSRAASPEPGCPRVHRTRNSAIIDYADFIRWDDRDYIRISRRSTTKPDPARLVGIVNCEISELASGPHDRLGKIRDGNAVSLPVGTRLYASHHRRRCVLMARIDQGWASWLAHGCHPKSH